jgi:Tol biopolymer transport system component/DNA-binding winged helix-turn-helix (wHTH) protein
MEHIPLIYQFDDVQVEPRAFRVVKAGQAVPLEPKAFEVLVFLINHRERVIEKDELLSAVWKDTFVTPNAMTRVIAQLRKRLGDDAREARYIETVPTRGYRFIAEVQVKAEPGLERNGELAGNGRAAHATSALDAAPGAVSVASSPPVTANPPEGRLWLGLPRKVWVVLGALLLTAFFVWKMQTPAPVTVAGVRKTTQITTTMGLDAYPAFSPDGSSLAYSSDRNGDFEIYIKPLAPGGRELPITRDGQQNVQPAWSPDGKLLAYHSRKRGGIWVVPALGGVARQLTDFGSRPAWSPDGAGIAFQSGGLPDLSQAAFNALPPSTIWIVPTERGTPRPLTQPGTPVGGHGSPTWSPDGKRVVFMTNDIGLSEVWAVSVDGAELKNLGLRGAKFYDPVYSPDGRFLYLAAAAGNFRLWRVPVSRAGLPEGEPREVANTGTVLTRHLAITPDGQRIAYSAMEMANHIGSVPIAPQSGEAAGPPALLTQDTTYRKTMQAFSPGGEKIAYAVWRQGAEGEVWMMDADGGNARQLTAEPARLLGWLPEGERVLVLSPDVHNPRLSVVDLPGGQQRLLAELSLEEGFKRPLPDGRRVPFNPRFFLSSRSSFAKLSPDARHIAFNSNEGGTINVWVASLEGEPPRQLTFDQELMGFACWSPDGQWLAFETKRGDDTHITMIPSRGGTPTQLTFARGQSWPNDWSPDGGKIAFAGWRDGVWNIWWVSRDGKTQKQVTPYTKPNIYVRYPAWSPRGDQIVYEYAETTGNIWLMELK